MTYLDELTAHQAELRERMDTCESDTVFVQLSQQWLKVSREIAEHSDECEDDLGGLLDGLSAVR